MQKKKKLAKLSRVGKVLAMVALLAAIAIVLVGTWAYYFYDAGRLDLPICTLSVPDGWIGEVREDYNGDDKSNMLMFEGKIRVPRVVCDLETSSGCLSYKKGWDSSHMRAIKSAVFLMRYDPEETRRTVDGKTITVLRYKGPHYFGSDGKDVKADCDIVTICFFTDDGVVGLYMGFPEEEPDFWSMIDTIKWKL